MLIEKLAIALTMMFLCTMIHALFMMAANKAVDRSMAYVSHGRHPFRRAVQIWLIILWMFLGICVEAGIWAYTYLSIPSITTLPDAPTAFYFSLVTYTSLGFGDIVLTGDWRVLSAIEAATGVIIFGWTTALIFYFIQKIYKTG